MRKVLILFWTMAMLFGTTAYADKVIYTMDDEIHVTEETPLTGWGSEIMEICEFEFDIKFGGENSGIMFTDKNGVKNGTKIFAMMNNDRLRMTIPGSTNLTPFTHYVDIDTENWYHIKIKGNYGAPGAGLDMYVTYDTIKTDEDGKSEKVTETKEYLAIPPGDMAASTFAAPEHFTLLENTSVKNIKILQYTEDEIKISSASDSLSKGTSQKLSVNSLRLGEAFKPEVEAQFTMDSADGVTITNDGTVTVSKDSTATEITVTASFNGLTDTKTFKLVSSDLFTINSLVFNEDYTNLEEIEVTKNYYYRDSAKVIINFYHDNTLISNTVKNIQCSDIKSGDSCISLNCPVPDGFNVETDEIDIMIYTPSETTYQDSEIELTAIDKDGETYLPVRQTLEKLNGAVEWDSDRRVVTGMANTNTFVAQIDGNSFINSEKEDSSFIIENDLSYAKKSFLNKLFDFEIKWK